MKLFLRVAFCALLLAGCKDSRTTARVDDLQTKVDDLTQRVKTLEDDLLKANKQLIAQQQALQQMHEQVRDLETNMGKLQYSQTTTSR